MAWKRKSDDARTTKNTRDQTYIAKKSRTTSCSASDSRIERSTDSNSWDETPKHRRSTDFLAEVSSPTPKLPRSRWDEAPLTIGTAASTPPLQLAGPFNSQAVITPAIFPLLKVLCQNKESPDARHTGILFVQQIALVMGSAVVPHLQSLVEIIQHGLYDEFDDVRIITAQALGALAQASAPYGITSFASVLDSLLNTSRSQWLNIMNASLEAIATIIPLMDAIQARFYTKVIIDMFTRDLKLRDIKLLSNEANYIMLKVIKQCVSHEGVEADYIRNDILPDLLCKIWAVESTAYSNQSSEQLVETTTEIAKKVGVADIVGRIVKGLKDESERHRMMVMETIEKIVVDLGTNDIDAHLEQLLIDGIIYAFKVSLPETFGRAVDDVMLNGFVAVVNSLGRRVKPYLPQICNTIKPYLSTCTYVTRRRHAAVLISRIAVVLKQCEGEELMRDLGVLLYENLGTDCPEVLGSILGALKSIVSVSDATRMAPPLKNLLPRLTPILKNQHEKVRENCIELVCLIVDML
ncbi:Splicing factor subunit [Heracleum sosnowskyi]|uniref:Splicing factor subunit n=1 Tax=Heracleum sosnowskyi TaxID=360622 RepID=A0AAD8M2U3_9APIA|nr:Splicing factor subunit [Heracleum sosnowskyi]